MLDEWRSVQQNTRRGDSAPFRVYSQVHALAGLENGVATIPHTPTTHLRSPEVPWASWLSCADAQWRMPLRIPIGADPAEQRPAKPPRMKQQDLNENRQMDCRRGRCALGRVGILSMLQRTEPQTMVPPQASSPQGTLITCRRHRSPSAMAARQVHSRPCLRECLWTYTKPRNVRTSAG